MKIILSRKGFDSTAGGYPSPIINGIPLSLPIPDTNDKIKYSELYYKNELNYFDIMKQLGINGYDENSTCHHDPDFKLGVIGQIKQAQSHLENQGVGIGDLFLFFGWFRETEIKNSKIFFKRNGKYPDGFHLIFGYLEIGQIIKTAIQTIPLKLRNYPHFSREDLRKDKTNAIYIAKEKLTLRQNQAGFGILPFSEKLILTKEYQPRSYWDKNKIKKLEGLNISYHSPQSWQDEYFISAGRGQEFVIKENKLAEEWALELIEK